MILCLDASTDHTIIGVVREGHVVAEHDCEIRDRLADEIAELFLEACVSPKDMKKVVVGVGPGSFTGLRVSLAFAKGFARGLGSRILPISSLKSIAANYSGTKSEIVVIAHARRGQVHFARYSCPSLDVVTSPMVVDHGDILRHLNSNTVLLGDVLKKMPPEIVEPLKEYLPEKETYGYPRVLEMVKLALVEWETKIPPEIGDVAPEYGLEFPA